MSSRSWPFRGRSTADRSGLPAAAVLVLGVLLVALAAAGWFALHARHVDAGIAPAAVLRPATIRASAGPQTHVVPGPHVAPLPSGPALRLRLDAVGVDAAVVPETVASDGTLGVPEDVHELGWWAGGAGVGASTGTTVIDGHVDSAAQGPGALFRLAEVPLGSVINISTTQGVRRYVVRARRSYPKAALPADLFRQNGPGQLVVITCGGSFNSNRGHYSNNIVVYATLASS